MPASQTLRLPRLKTAPLNESDLPVVVVAVEAVAAVDAQLVAELARRKMPLRLPRLFPLRLRSCL